MLVQLAFAMQRLKKYLKKNVVMINKDGEGGNNFCICGRGDTAVMRRDIELIGGPPTRENPVQRHFLAINQLNAQTFKWNSKEDWLSGKSSSLMKRAEPFKFIYIYMYILEWPFFQVLTLASLFKVRESCFLNHKFDVSDSGIIRSRLDLTFRLKNDSNL